MTGSSRRWAEVLAEVALVVAVHGIGNQYRGESVMHARWFPAMRDGLIRAGGELRPDDLLCAFYGDLFRPQGRVLGDEPWYEASDVSDGFEAALLDRWWSATAESDPEVVEAGTLDSLGRTPRSVQAALNALTNSRFFAGLAERMLVLSLKQVRAYLTDDEVRTAALARVERMVSEETRVLVGHSLGSVVAYEALCAHPEWPVRTLVTLGSPLGVRNLVFDRLHPAPSDGVGHWPGSVATWTNVADDGDVVALQKDLRLLFGDRVNCHIVHCGAKAHDARRYLTAETVGRAIATGIADV